MCIFAQSENYIPSRWSLKIESCPWKKKLMLQLIFCLNPVFWLATQGGKKVLSWMLGISHFVWQGLKIFAF